PKIAVRDTLNSTFGVGLRLTFQPSMYGCGFSDTPLLPTVPVGICTNWWPESWPIKNCMRIGPRTPKKLGSLNGFTRSYLSMVTGGALSLNKSGPPYSGPHHSDCLPNES